MDGITSQRRASAHLPARPVVKICGLTRLDDILAAIALGAWALGFVFAPSPRRLGPSEARDLLDRVAAAGRRAGQAGPPLAVGVFGEMTADEIAGIVKHVDLDAVQLHGRRGPAPSEVRGALAGWSHAPRLGEPVAAGQELGPASLAPLIIRAVQVGPNGDDPVGLQRSFALAAAEADLVLLDTRTEGRLGGSGIAFPWRLAWEAADGAPFLLAGGIDPSNVVAALAQSGAWGVDVSSGVESSPGCKDARLMAELVARVKAAREATSSSLSICEQPEGPTT